MKGDVTDMKSKSNEGDIPVKDVDIEFSNLLSADQFAEINKEILEGIKSAGFESGDRTEKELYDCVVSTLGGMDGAEEYPSATGWCTVLGVNLMFHINDSNYFIGDSPIPTQFTQEWHNDLPSYCIFLDIDGAERPDYSQLPGMSDSDLAAIDPDDRENHREEFSTKIEDAIADHPVVQYAIKVLNKNANLLHNSIDFWRDPDNHDFFLC